MPTCAFLSMDNIAEFVTDDELAVPYLMELGWEVSFVPWRSTSVDWNQFDVVIIRSTWDYQQDPEEFADVLEQIENSSARLANPLDVCLWNLEKSYLAELETKGVDIVPTVWGAELTRKRYERLWEELQCECIVIKPIVSANADHTYRLSSTVSERITERVLVEFQERAFMVQPFLNSIVDEGEYSLFYFLGEFSHAILKTPREGDFRVQEEHGGVIQSIKATEEMKLFGRRVLDASYPDLPYARVDMVKFENRLVLIELELIEPALYFRTDEQSPARFARALDERYSRTT